LANTIEREGHEYASRKAFLAARDRLSTGMLPNRGFLAGEEQRLPQPTRATVAVGEGGELELIVKH